MSIKKVFFVFLLVNVISSSSSYSTTALSDWPWLSLNVISDLLKGIVLPVSMLQFQYSLKLSFSSTLAGVYL
jgi:hypothetical protein